MIPFVCLTWSRHKGQRTMSERNFKSPDCRELCVEEHEGVLVQSTVE